MNPCTCRWLCFFDHNRELLHARLHTWVWNCSSCFLAHIEGNTPVPEEHFQRNSSWSTMVALNVTGLHDGHLLQKVSSTSYPSEKVITRKPRKPRKKVKAIICVLFVELFERFTFLGIVCNMILFCTIKLGYDNYQAATVNLCFVGASTLTPVLVGWFAEMCLGRKKVFYLCALLHFFGESVF